jgi:hypothetical protein
MKVPTSYRTQGSLPCTQELITRCCPELVESSSHAHPISVRSILIFSIFLLNRMLCTFRIPPNVCYVPCLYLILFILRLFKNTFSSSDYVILNILLFMNNELERMWKENLDPLLPEKKHHYPLTAIFCQEYKLWISLYCNSILLSILLLLPLMGTNILLSTWFSNTPQSVFFLIGLASDSHTHTKQQMNI